MKFYPHKKDKSYPKVCYFYMPPFDNKPAEIIEVLHSDTPFIKVPMRDEDKELLSFYQRPVTAMEVAQFGKQQTWQIFTSWQELEDDHAKWQVPPEVVQELERYKSVFSLNELMTA